MVFGRVRDFRSVSSLCRVAAVVAVGLAVLASGAESATAKSKFSAIAVDARTGKILFSQDPDGLRHPASLTKVMTLYLLFEQLKAGKIHLDSRLKVSRAASRRPPTKLGLRVGQTIAVEDAIKGLVTKSANDAASVIAENLSLNEAAFAVKMTRKARELGMAHTVFRNASGLPDPRQVTTARDMATLSLRIQRDFPQYYPYFRTMSFRFNGKLIKTHNRLLGRFAGTDGIKTGYIRASGFNLTSSVKRGDKRIIGVVMGARSGGARNAYMMSMLDRAISKCKPGKALAVAIQGVTPKPAADDSVIEIAEAKVPAPKGEKQNDAATAIPPAAELQESEQESDQDSDEDAAEAAENGVTPGDSASLDDAITAASRPTVEDTPEGDAEEQGSTLLTKTVPDGSPLPFAVKPPGEDGGVVIDPPTMTSWTIQIGAYPDKKDAQNILYKLRDLHLEVLEEKEALTIEVQKGSDTLYRARFSGFSETDARTACKRVSARGFNCVAFGPQS